MTEMGQIYTFCLDEVGSETPLQPIISQEHLYQKIINVEQGFYFDSSCCILASRLLWWFISLSSIYLIKLI